jgi:hypothetical protein
MEKFKKAWDLFAGNQSKNLSEKTIRLINQILRDPWEEFADRIDFVINKIIFSIDPETIKDPVVQKEIFFRYMIFWIDCSKKLI